MKYSGTISSLNIVITQQTNYGYKSTTRSIKQKTKAGCIKGSNCLFDGLISSITRTHNPIASIWKHESEAETGVEEEKEKEERKRVNFCRKFFSLWCALIYTLAIVPNTMIPTPLTKLVMKPTSVVTTTRTECVYWQRLGTQDDANYSPVQPFSLSHSGPICAAPHKPSCRLVAGLARTSDRTNHGRL